MNSVAEQVMPRSHIAVATHGELRLVVSPVSAPVSALQVRRLTRPGASPMSHFVRFQTIKTPSSAVALNSRGRRMSPVPAARQRVSVSPSSL